MVHLKELARTFLNRNDEELNVIQVHLTNVYIYDISSGSWSVQPTTATDGRSNKVYESVFGPQIGIPQSRDHMCTVAGKAADESSYNLYFYGGKNDTNSLGDIWALSLPR